MSFLRRKIKVTEEEFAKVLFGWVTLRLDASRVRQAAELFEFDIGSKNNLNRLSAALFDLNMWLVVHTCERVITDFNKRNTCLDIFHSLVHQGLLEDGGLDFSEWLMHQGTKYVYYDKASETKHELGLLWELAKVFNTKLHGELKRDPFVQAGIAHYIGSSIGALEGLVKKYEISNG